MKYTNSKMRAIDIGAHNGRYTLAFQTRAREVIAFEPVPYVSEQLRRKVRNNVRVYCVAVSDVSGTSDFFVPKTDSAIVDTRSSLKYDANPGFELDRISVITSTLDAFNLSDISIIKIDVEGNEIETLKGAAETIKRSRPVLLVEIEERHNPGKFWSTIEFIHSFGYWGFFYDDGNFIHVGEFLIERDQNIEKLKEPFGVSRGRYINNFFFFPQD